MSLTPEATVTFSKLKKKKKDSKPNPAALWKTRELCEVCAVWDALFQVWTSNAHDAEKTEDGLFTTPFLNTIQRLQPSEGIEISTGIACWEKETAEGWWQPEAELVSYKIPHRSDNLSGHLARDGAEAMTVRTAPRSGLLSSAELWPSKPKPRVRTPQIDSGVPGYPYSFLFPTWAHLMPFLCSFCTRRMGSCTCLVRTARLCPNTYGHSTALSDMNRGPTSLPASIWCVFSFLLGFG